MTSSSLSSHRDLQEHSGALNSSQGYVTPLYSHLTSASVNLSVGGICRNLLPSQARTLDARGDQDPVPHQIEFTRSQLEKPLNRHAEDIERIVPSLSSSLTPVPETPYASHAAAPQIEDSLDWARRARDNSLSPLAYIAHTSRSRSISLTSPTMPAKKSATATVAGGKLKRASKSSIAVSHKLPPVPTTKLHKQSALPPDTDADMYEIPSDDDSPETASKPKLSSKTTKVVDTKRKSASEVVSTSKKAKLDEDMYEPPSHDNVTVSAAGTKAKANTKKSVPTKSSSAKSKTASSLTSKKALSESKTKEQVKKQVPQKQENSTSGDNKRCSTRPSAAKVQSYADDSDEEEQAVPAGAETKRSAKSRVAIEQVKTAKSLSETAAIWEKHDMFAQPEDAHGSSPDDAIMVDDGSDDPPEDDESESEDELVEDEEDQRQPARLPPDATLSKTTPACAVVEPVADPSEKGDTSVQAILEMMAGQVPNHQPDTADCSPRPLSDPENQTMGPQDTILSMLEDSCGTHVSDSQPLATLDHTDILPTQPQVGLILLATTKHLVDVVLPHEKAELAPPGRGVVTASVPIFSFAPLEITSIPPRARAEQPKERRENLKTISKITKVSTAPVLPVKRRELDPKRANRSESPEADEDLFKSSTARKDDDGVTSSNLEEVPQMSSDTSKAFTPKAAYRGPKVAPQEVSAMVIPSPVKALHVPITDSPTKSVKCVRFSTGGTETTLVRGENAIPQPKPAAIGRMLPTEQSIDLYHRGPRPLLAASAPEAKSTPAMASPVSCKNDLYVSSLLGGSTPMPTSAQPIKTIPESGTNRPTMLKSSSPLRRLTINVDEESDSDDTEKDGRDDSSSEDSDPNDSNDETLVDNVPFISLKPHQEDLQKSLLEISDRLLETLMQQEYTVDISVRKYQRHAEAMIKGLREDQTVTLGRFESAVKESHRNLSSVLQTSMEKMDIAVKVPDMAPVGRDRGTAHAAATLRTLLASYN